MTDFLDLEAGDYSVREENRPDYQPQTPICQAVTVGDPALTTASFGPAAYPPAGRDEFPSGALLSVELLDGSMVHVTLNGPSAIQRGEPRDAGGLQVIDTELLSMNLSGVSPMGPLMLRESPTLPSHGQVKQRSAGADFPADSFFDVFFDISLDGGQHWQPVQDPVRMEAEITAIPPILAYYRPPQPIAVPVIGPNGQTVAIIRHALHVPLPIYEKLIVFVNYQLKTPTPTPTASPTPTATPTQKPVLTGISSTFVATADGHVVITVHVVDPAFDRKIYDMEIFPNEQTPPWPAGQPISGPQGWQPVFMPTYIGWVTANNPLITCQPVQFGVMLPPTAAIGDAISLHMTDQSHNNLGYVTSTRVVAPGVSAGSAWPAPWSPGGLVPGCSPG
jgi:hypothetical protein